MAAIVAAMLAFIRLLVVVFFRSRAALAAENLALRHQLGVLQRSAKRPRLRARDRALWVWLCAHLLRVLGDYFEYYHGSRAHQSLKGNAPMPREVETPERGQVGGTPVLGGLHHTYRRAA